MAGEDVVNVPFFGDQRKEYLIAGGAVVAGYLGYKAWKKRAGGGGSAGAAAAGTNGLGTFVGYDATGAPVYQNAQGQDVDANGNPDTLVTPAGTTGAGGYSNPAPITVSGAQGPGPGSAPTTDQQWTQAVVQDLTGLAMDPQAVATAIALYLGSQPLTTAQQMIIRTAWAYEGRPPQHPQLPIVPAQSPPTGSPPPGGGTPPSGGPPAPTGGNPWALTGRAVGPTEVDLSWKAQPPPWNGTYRVMYGVSGNVGQNHYDTTATTAKIGALKGGVPYTFSVEGVSGGVLSPPSPQLQITTPVA